MKNRLENKFDNNQTVFTHNKIFIGETEITKAKLFSNPNGNAGKFLCSHVMRLISELKLKDSNLISGFIHIPQYPNFEQLAEVINIILSEFIKSSQNQVSSILITSFTKFASVYNNSTSDFLFDDGISNNIESFGIKNFSKNNINRIIRFLKNEYLDISIKYIDYKLDLIVNNKKFDLYFLRLPVDNRFIYDNSIEDITKSFLIDSFNQIKPSLIISLGVGVYDKTDEYNIEINAEGMNNIKYLNEKFIPNYDFSLIYENYFNKEQICQQ
ncbi:MAG: hypothetical protein U0354_13470 [Candidatus Sericytochromatia bacterium]